ncbi:armadillo-type protein [Suillus fuscotomentosus]|uniref:Armadillo-type protein n=1 Tax=Suillus fuscotomentosus TaxID=1912939 RepID=A0AAD4HG07_9AGAM|nr:armadillo-type protein [Suillus fuscotomentosus]KAG1896250.1 armadillo-type protein [Suillus fuscotomentosus]
MQSLLRWGVENSSPNEAPPPTNKLDPGIIDHILGKPDAQLMKEALTVGLDERQAEDDRLQALDDLEMLVQNIDNANDLTKLGIWQPLHNLLLASTTSDALRMQTLWIIGTALQNNPAAQLAYFDLDPLPALLKSLSPSSNSAETRSRALYALSGLLKLNSAAVKKMSVADGWSALRMCLEDSEIRVRRKTTFLLNTLLLPTSSPSSQANLQPNISLPTSENAPPPIHANSHASMLSDPSSVSTSALTLAAIQEDGEQGGSLLDALISALIEPVPFGVDGEIDKDDEFQENIVRILYTFATSCNGAFSAVQKRSLWGFLGKLTTTQGEENLDFGLTSREWEELSGVVRS